jgi:hypothetical protein
MIPGLHDSLRRLVHEKARILPGDVDVCFDAPRREWITSLTRPTVDFFLFDVRENTELRSTSLQSTRGNGTAQYRMPPRRFDMRYCVTAISTLVDDEHALLWRLLATLLKHSELPGEVLDASLRTLDPPVCTQVLTPEEPGLLLDVWSGFEVPPRPALLYVVTVPLELDITFEAPLVLTRTARYARPFVADRETEDLVHIGGVVRDRSGRPLANAVVAIDGRPATATPTDPDGRFVLTGLSEGPVRLSITRDGRTADVVTLDVPADSYELVID